MNKIFKTKVRKHRPPKVIPGVDIKGYEGLYRITKDGRVWSYHMNDFKATSNHRGLEYIMLHKDGIKKWHSVSVLVLEAYICKKPFPDAVAMHIDSIPSNNNVDNLRWGTNEEVMSRTARGEKNYHTMLKDADVRKIREMYAAGQIGRGKKGERYTLTEVGKMFGISRPAVWRIIHRYTWNHV